MGRKKRLRKAIKEAGPNISRSELKDIVSVAGGNVTKAINQISKVGTNLNSGAVNMLIKAPPATGYGETRLGQTLQQLAGSPSTVRYVKGQQVGQPAVAPQLMIGGTTIRSGGSIAVKDRPVQAATQQPTGYGGTTLADPVVSNPFQAEIDALTNQLAGLKETVALNEGYMQDYINQITQDSQLQAQQMSEMFNAQLAQQEQAYAQQVAAQNALAQQEQEAARAFMINQARSVSPANLQIGATYGTPKLAGTQGFKYRPTTTPDQVASAFTAPTLAAAATTPTQQLQPTVLNV